MQTTHNNKGEYQSIIDRILKPLLDHFKGAETRAFQRVATGIPFYLAEKFGAGAIQAGQRLLTAKTKWD